MKTHTQSELEQIFQREFMLDAEAREDFRQMANRYTFDAPKPVVVKFVATSNTLAEGEGNAELERPAE